MKSVLKTQLPKEEGSKEKSLSPKLSKKKEKRDKLIRIRSYNYDRLAELGNISEDFDDALTKVLDYYYKTRVKGSGD